MLFESPYRKKAKNRNAEKLKSLKDRIAAFMAGELDTLNEADADIMNRWIAIWGELEGGKSSSQAVTAHMAKYEGVGKGISRRTAFMDLRNATELFGNFQQVSRRAQIVLLHEYAMKAFQTAVVSKNLTELNKAISNLKDVVKLAEPYFEKEEVPRAFILQLGGANGKVKNFDLNTLHEQSSDDYAEIIESMEGEEPTVEDIKLLLTRNDQHGRSQAT